MLRNELGIVEIIKKDYVGKPIKQREKLLDNVVGVAITLDGEEETIDNLRYTISVVNDDGVMEVIKFPFKEYTVEVAKNGNAKIVI